VSPALKELRWLLVKEHLYYRDAVMEFKCLTGCAPEYFSTLNFELLNFIFYLNTVNLSDKKIILNLNSENSENKEILLYIDAVCVLSIQTKKSRQPFRKD